jgi:quercetin dioxygenase-like cupin family protein
MIRHVSITDGEYTETQHFHGAPANNLLLHRSADGCHLVFASEMPQGARFTETRDSIEEAFYLIRGTVRCTLPTGEVLIWKEGDLVYWPYDQPMEIEYSPALLAICFFWAEEPISIPIADT